MKTWNVFEGLEKASEYTLKTFHAQMINFPLSSTFYAAVLARGLGHLVGSAGQ